MLATMGAAITPAARSLPNRERLDSILIILLLLEQVPSRIVLEFDDVFRGSINLADLAARSRS
jgi:hypothetical protein